MKSLHLPSTSRKQVRNCRICPSMSLAGMSISALSHIWQRAREGSLGSLFLSMFGTSRIVTVSFLDVVPVDLFNEYVLGQGLEILACGVKLLTRYEQSPTEMKITD